MNLTKQDLMKAMEKEPGLTDMGISWKTSGDDFERHRTDLADNLKDFRLCCKWLSQCKQIKTINRQAGNSYSLKPLIEAWAGKYISNGAIIAAAIHLEIPYQTFFDSPNICLALSNRCPFIKRSREFLKADGGMPTAPDDRD